MQYIQILVISCFEKFLLKSSQISLTNIPLNARKIKKNCQKSWKFSEKIIIFSHNLKNFEVNSKGKHYSWLLRTKLSVSQWFQIFLIFPRKSLSIYSDDEKDYHKNPQNLIKCGLSINCQTFPFGCLSFLLGSSLTFHVMFENRTELKVSTNNQSKINLSLRTNFHL